MALRLALGRRLVLRAETAGADIHSARRPAHVDGGPMNVREPARPRPSLRVANVVSRHARLRADLTSGHFLPLTDPEGFSRIVFELTQAQTLSCERGDRPNNVAQRAPLGNADTSPRRGCFRGVCPQMAVPQAALGRPPL